MNDNQNQKIAANYMGAVAHAFSGNPGRHSEFIDKVELILSGSEPHAMQLMQFSDRVRQTGRPVIWIHHSAGAPNVPQIGLVAYAFGKMHFVENCMLWMSAKGSRVRLVPDNFKMGTFRFDDELRLRHVAGTPAKNFKAAEVGMERAYLRLREIEHEQRERGEVFALPSHARAA